MSGRVHLFLSNVRAFRPFALYAPARIYQLQCHEFANPCCALSWTLTAWLRPRNNAIIPFDSGLPSMKGFVTSNSHWPVVVIEVMGA